MARHRKGGHGRRNGDDHDQPAPRVRSHSIGEYGKLPRSPRCIKVSSTHILDNTATKTLLAILRAHWPEGVFSFNEAPESFWTSVLSEFRSYYCYTADVSDAEGDAVVKQHVARTMTQTLYEDKNRAELRAERDGTSLLEQCPIYYDRRVWSSFCTHWLKESFRKKSAINTQNRKKLRVVHTTGAKSFNKFKEDLTEKNQETPTQVQLWDKTHKKKDTDEWASEEARLIGERMRAIIASRQTPQESTPGWDSGISALLEAQGPIKKNRVLGLPRVPANSIVLGGQHPRETHRTQSNSNNNTSNSSGAGPSRSGPGIPSDILAELVQNILEALRSDPSFYGSKHPSQEQLHLLAQEVISGSDLSSTPQIYEMMRTEMVRLMVRIFEDIFRDILQRLSGKDRKDDHE
ncbi:hypothetical protein L6452_40283 [Arctium lappa]|uniref:Uncharacterized protein n=1 Tax=Arctium lappa TaxID=4217 RepID=A0ACB8XM88_ARCLA|nr:hypothetical protein L6452_40283 [Arctium lappa]